MKYFVMLFVIGCFVVSCGSSTKEPNDQKTDNDPEALTMNSSTEATASACTSDADCVPASCCHPKSCVLKSEAPTNCGEMLCTAECKEGTMDCGKGSCGCKDGACVVNWAD